MSEDSFDYGAAETDLRSQGYRFAQLEMADIHGLLRGKITGLTKALSPSGNGVSTLILGGRGADQISFTPFSNIDLGFPKMTAKPDFSTLRRLPWTGDMISLLFDYDMDDGSACPVDPRQILKRILREYRDLNIEPMVALEFECYVFEADQAVSEQRWRSLKPVSKSVDFYCLTRTPSYIDLAKTFIGRMEDIGIEIEAFHTEYGRGMFEYIVGPQSALAAADAAARTKLYFKQLCAERGLVASFMPVLSLSPGDSAVGMHHNVSIWRDGQNLCWDEAAGGLSPIARHFAAGLLETLPDLHLVFRPWVNSFRRMDPHAWSPVSASWGLDNHTGAIRVVHGSKPPKYSRFEHRVAGSDVNPYLTIAAILAGGLRGIRAGAEPPAYGVGNIAKDERFPKLSTDLASAVARFSGSEVAQDVFGKVFVEHYSSIKRDEWADYVAWCEADRAQPHGGRVTDWEFARYFDWA